MAHPGPVSAPKCLPRSKNIRANNLLGRDKIMVSNRHRPAVKASERSHSRYRHAPASAMLGWRQGLLGDTIFLAQRPHIAAQRPKFVSCPHGVPILYPSVPMPSFLFLAVPGAAQQPQGHYKTPPAFLGMWVCRFCATRAVETETNAEVPMQL